MSDRDGHGAGRGQQPGWDLTCVHLHLYQSSHLIEGTAVTSSPPVTPAMSGLSTLVLASDGRLDLNNEKLRTFH